MKGFWGAVGLIAVCLIIVTGTKALRNRISVPEKTILESKPLIQKNGRLDSVSILLIGDSMLEGLSPRLGAYAIANGHQLHTVIWYGSTSYSWAAKDKLSNFIEKYHPSIILLSIGSNELFINDPSLQAQAVKKILSICGTIPSLWIGPAHESKSITKTIRQSVTPGSFFDSSQLKLSRKKDGIHPTRQGGIIWADSVVKWMNMSSKVSPDLRHSPIFEIHKPASLTLLPPGH